MLNLSKVQQCNIDYHLSMKGIYTIHSDVKGISMAYWNDNLVIFTLTGNMAVQYKDLPDFIRWLKTINKTGYVPLNMPITFTMPQTRLKISCGEKGCMEIWRTRLKPFTEELEGVYEDLTDRKRMKLKNA